MCLVMPLTMGGKWDSRLSPRGRQPLVIISLAYDTQWPRASPLYNKMTRTLMETIHDTSMKLILKLPSSS